MKSVTVRSATFSDIPAIYALMLDIHARSRLAHHAVNEKAAKSLLVTAIQRHGARTSGGMFVAVADGPSGVEAFIMGVVQPIYHALDALEATDLYWVARPGAGATSAVRLLKAMHKWAASVPGVAQIRHGATDAAEDPRRTGRLLERQGFRQCGGIHERMTQK